MATDSIRWPAGHMILRDDGPHGTQGTGYDYIMARDGVYIQARNETLTARFRLAKADIRGLDEIERKIELTHGRIPRHLFELGLSWMLTTPGEEKFFAIRHEDGHYRLNTPEQEGRASSLQYTPPRNAVVEFHSHGRLEAFFSETDDRDEQGFRIYGVVGRLDKERPQLRMRVGIYGHFGPVRWDEVFRDGPPQADEQTARRT